MKMLLPFYDDSSLFFVSKMKWELEKENLECSTLFVGNGRKFDRISDRQMEAIFPKGPDFVADTSELAMDFVCRFDAVIVCKITDELRLLFNNESFIGQDARPCFIAFQPGLEFTPEKGIRHRQAFDAVFLNSKEDFLTYGSAFPQKRWRYVSWGHPYFIKPDSLKEDTGGPIYFFAQAISPSTRNARVHIAEVMKAIALANPQRQIVIKLRNLPSENANHLHKEKYSYPELFTELSAMPPNLSFSACAMKDALQDASIVITCTSTAAMDAISAGLPTMVYTDYVENYLDSMASAMTKIFSSSGLITPLKRVLHLEYSRPQANWLNGHFRDRSLFREIKKITSAFKDREASKPSDKIENYLHEL